jgi:CheY-like chemotaxis protein
VHTATILLIEDNPLTRKLVRAALAKEDWSLLEATTGAAAMGIVEDARLDLILLDLVLPDISGYDLVRHIRAQAKCLGVPILAFTGLLSNAEEAKALNGGFDGFVAKPIEPSQLRHIIRGHMPARTAAPTILGKGKRLLIADDNAQQLKLARYRLSRLGFDVQAVGDGMEAIEAARSARPDVIVTDALMPRLDGFGVCLTVRQDPALADVPVVLVTSSYLEAADRELASRVGADAYVVRTADLADVIAALEDIFRSGSPRPGALAATAVAGEVDAVRSQRALQQLERQVAVNSGLMQRCSTLSAELSVLTTVADALVEMRDVEGALRDILANCLDVAGASRGAIFTREPDGGLCLRAEHGFQMNLQALSDLARGSLPSRAESPDESFEVVFAGTNALVVPMRGRTKLRGCSSSRRPTAPSRTTGGLSPLRSVPR